MRITIELRREVRLARLLWGNVNKYLEESLFVLLKSHRLSVKRGDLLLLNGSWYITHSGLLRLACRKHCRGIRVQPVREFWDGGLSRFAFRAKVYTSEICKGFDGYGDADPSNVPPLVRGAEMRVAETRAVNRALRKAYGIGICLVEEIGSFAEPAPSPREAKKLPSQPVNGKNGNYGGPKVRDR